MPSGSFERIRGRARRRRRLRTAASGGLAATVALGSLYLLGVPGPFWNNATPVPATGGTAQPAVSSSNPPATGSPSPRPTPPARTPAADRSRRALCPPAPPRPARPAQPAARPAARPSRPRAPRSPRVGPAWPGDLCHLAADGLARGLGRRCGQPLPVPAAHQPRVGALHGGRVPGAVAARAQGTQIGASATFDHTFGYTPVLLQPGATASDTVHTLNAGATSCSGTSTSLRIYPPGDRDAVVIPGQVMLCGGELSVSPFTQGSGGNPPS
ncbi:DUF4232 domain-containing protein [Streptacidiphilus sp. 4-A2]|nr:DUF4232 domain-containing protein [Streptacidiphilus sp. 4-A2]